MRTSGQLGSALLVTGLAGVLLTGCGLDDPARDVADSAGQAATAQVRSACDGAVRKAEQSLAEQGEARVDQLARELARYMPSTCRDQMSTVAAEIDRTAKDRDLDDALASGAPAEERQRWHDMAVDICTDRVVAQAGSMVG
jgi:hypothetical protein